MTEATVKLRRGNVMRKMHAKPLPELVATICSTSTSSGIPRPKARFLAIFTDISRIVSGSIQS
ncbi:hypothetical protein [Rhizobium sp. IBUN]|uniref:hypothetical protein n=1 Tax=Rhizobium sp. IBUN TaxID=1042326 RepID=UPI001FD9373C|nr:hypothetical protein [Rhizobium sp. IBUN]